MSYISQVSIECGNKAAELIREVADRLEFKPDHVYLDKKHKQFILVWEDVKWIGYEGCYHIEQMQNALNDCSLYRSDKDDYSWAWRMVAIGEQPGDIFIDASDEDDRADLHQVWITFDFNKRIFKEIETNGC